MIDKIICLGKNYVEHAIEMGEGIVKKPVIFLKPPSVLQQAKTWGSHLSLRFPESATNVQPECEIVIRINQDGYQVDLETASHMIDAVTLGLDMTLRDRQAELKKHSQPWTTAKVFIDAAIIGPFIPLHEFNDYLDVEFSLAINGHITQQAKGHEMMMQPQEMIVYLSHFFPLCAGDIIFTGTPKGVSAIHKGSIAKLSWREWYYTVTW